MKHLLSILLLLLAGTESLRAQTVLQRAASDLEHGARDVWHVWTAPFHATPDDWRTFGIVLGTGGALLLVDEPIQEWVDTHPESAPVRALDWFREDEPGEELGDIWYTFRFAGIGWVAGLLTGSETLREASMGCAAAGVAQGVARRYVIFKAVERTRPAFTDDAFEFSVPGSSEWSGRSFIGGHAANALTCIGFLGTRYDLGYVEPVLYAAGIAAGLARIADQAHWTSDNVLGMTFGYAIGRAVGLRALDRARTGSGESDGTGAADAPLDWLSRISVGPGPDGALRMTATVRF